MAKKKGAEGVYRVIDVIGTSKNSWEDAAKSAVGTAAKSLRDLRIAEVTKMDMKVRGREGGRLPRAGAALVQVRGLSRGARVVRPGLALAARVAAEQLLDRLRRRAPLEQHRADRARDRHVDRAAARASASHFARRCARPRRHGRAARGSPSSRSPRAERQADAAVARQVAGAGEDQVARAGEAHEGLGAPAERDASRVISARPRVISAARAFCPRPRPSQMPAAIAMHVLHRAADLDADQVVAGVDAQPPRCSCARGRRGERGVGDGERQRASAGRAPPRARSSARKARRTARAAPSASATTWCGSVAARLLEALARPRRRGSRCRRRARARARRAGPRSASRR